MIDLSPLRDASICIFGNNGFLGRAVKELAESVGASCYGTQSEDGERDYNATSTSEVHYLLSGRPDYVINLAGFNGGVGFGASHAFDIFDINTLIPLEILSAAAVRYHPKKILMPIASCAYPVLDREEPWLDPIPEESLFRDEPHPSVMAHAYAKRNVQLACQFAHQQFGLAAVTVCPPTLFGPRDRYSPERSKIMAGMVRRFADAADENVPEVTCWGSGTPLREYLFVKDAAHLLLQALLVYEDSSLPLNIGCGEEHTIFQTAKLVAEVANYRGKINWDTTKPDGQYRKRLDLTRMHQILGRQAVTPFREALAETVAAYRRDRDAGSLR